jgi:hypothetical protein
VRAAVASFFVGAASSRTHARTATMMLMMVGRVSDRCDFMNKGVSIMQNGERIVSSHGSLLSVPVGGWVGPGCVVLSVVRYGSLFAGGLVCRGSSRRRPTTRAKFWANHSSQYASRSSPTPPPKISTLSKRAAASS